jgi:hypothetical protein
LRPVKEASIQLKHRARQATLLKDMEYHENGEEPGQRFDFGIISRELGIG